MRPANERRRYCVTPSHSLRAYTEWPLNRMRIHSLLGPANDEVPLWDISPHHCLYNILPVAVRMLPGSWTPWWRHQMETLSALLAFVRWIQRSPVNSPHKGQWRGALLFSLICSWINGWVNNGEAGDFRRHCNASRVWLIYTVHAMIYAHGFVVVCFLKQLLMDFRHYYQI